MTVRYPLVLNGSTIQELQTGDTIAGTPVTTSILKGDGAGGVTNAVAGTDYVPPAGTGATGTWGINVSGSSSSSATASSCSGNSATATAPASGGSFITSLNIGSQSVNYANSAGSAGSSTSSTNSTYATYPASGGSFVTSTNIGSQSVNYANSAGSAPANGGTSTYATNTVGYGQSWQNVSGSRAGSTNYTNTTGKPIQVLITTNTNGNFYIDGVNISSIYNNGTSPPLSAVIPNGSYYSWNGGFNVWAELR